MRGFHIADVNANHLAFIRFVPVASSAATALGTRTVVAAG